MKKILNEPDFIGGQGELTKDEESALSKHFAKKKNKKKVLPTLPLKRNKTTKKKLA